jgi:hypothetical protein
MLVVGRLRQLTNPTTIITFGNSNQPYHYAVIFGQCTGSR